MNELPNYEQRQLDRYEDVGSVEIYDANSDRFLGRLVNVHEAGLMIMGEAPIRADHVYQLELFWPSRKDPRGHIQLGVDCLWVRQSDDDSNPMCWAGCQIIDLSDSARDQIAMLISP